MKLLCPATGAGLHPPPNKKREIDAIGNITPDQPGLDEHTVQDDLLVREIFGDLA